VQFVALIAIEKRSTIEKRYIDFNAGSKPRDFGLAERNDSIWKICLPLPS
jgi:hypothetical protein